MKKRALALTAALALMTGMLAACGGGTADTSAADTAASTEAAADAAATEAAVASSADTAAGDTASSGDTVKIGGLAPLTGTASIYGIASSNGSKLYINEKNAAGGIDGKQIEFILQDEKGDAVEAVNGYNLLVEKSAVSAIIGDVTSTPSIAVAQLASQTGLPMITPTGTAAEITQQGDNVFRTCFLDAVQAQKMAQFVLENLGLKKVGILYDNGNEYSMGLTESFKETFTAGGGEVVAEESYSSDDIDFSSQISNIQSKDAEAIYLPDYYEKVTLITTQIRDKGITLPLIGGDGWDGVLNVTDDPSMFENCYFTNHYPVEASNEKLQKFIADYKEAYGMEPNSFSALGYDAALIMATAIENAGSTDSAAIVEAIKGITVDGVTGTISFDAEGNPIKDCYIITFKDGAYQLETAI